MRINHLIAGLILVVAVSPIFLSEASNNYQDLLNLTRTNEDTHMDARDLAFLLITHNFDAAPKESYVVVELNGTAYIMTPNGDKPGLADIAVKKD